MAAFLTGATEALAESGEDGRTCSGRGRIFVVVLSLCVRLPFGLGGSGDDPYSRLDDLGRAGVRLEATPTRRGSLFVEAPIGRSDRGRIAAAQDRDIASIEEDFARRFAVAPSVFTFAVPATFELGLQVLFRYAPTVARSLAAGHGGALDTRTLSTAIDWQVVRAQRPLTILRHELTHAMVHQIVGSEGELPAWLDEGIAVLEQQNVADAEDEPERDRAVTAALLASKRVSLSRLATTENWINQSARLGGSRTYAVARTAVDLLAQDVGRAGLVAMLERTGRGASFADAFRAVTGTSPEWFQASFGERVAAAAPAAAMTIDDRPRTDGNVGWALRGFPPDAVARVTIEGPAYHLVYTIVIDPYGMYSAVFGSTAPAGTYTVRVEAGSASASASLTAGVR